MVALGVTACGSSSNNSNPAPAKPVTPAPTEPTTPTPVEPTAPTPTEPTTPTPTEPTTPTPTEPTTPTPAEPTAPTPTEPMAPTPTESTTPTSVEPTKPASTFTNQDSKGNEWRIIGKDSDRSSHLGLYSYNLSPSTDTLHFQPDTKIDFAELSKNQLGVHSGKLDVSNEYGLINDQGVDKGVKALHYTFENLPYATYGVITFEGNESASVNNFSLSLSTGVPAFGATVDFDVRDPTYFTEFDHARLGGKATYKGNVIASYSSGRDDKYTIPEVDGEVIIEADFGKNEGTMSGQLTSKALDETLKLHTSNIFYQSYMANGGRVSGNGGSEGLYTGVFAGPNLDNAVGLVQVRNNDKNIEYRATFGGQKQPK